jgi:hypothetical protein
MNCIHCGRKFTCGCQKAKGADGFTVCKGCVQAYNAIVVTQKVTKRSAAIAQRQKRSIRHNEILNKNDRAARATR